MRAPLRVRTNFCGGISRGEYDKLLEAVNTGIGFRGAIYRSRDRPFGRELRASELSLIESRDHRVIVLAKD
jgi:hypothetical protein